MNKLEVKRRVLQMLVLADWLVNISGGWRVDVINEFLVPRRHTKMTKG